MAAINAPVPTWWDGVASTLDDPSQAWIHASAVPFVALAQLQPGESVLDLGCGTAVVALEAKSVLGNDHGAIVGIDQSHGMLQQARRLCEALNVSDDIIFHFGDITHLDAIPSFDNPSRNGSIRTFDVIFARNVLSSLPVTQQQAALCHWATYLTPGTGRLVVSYGVGAEIFGDIAGYMAINATGQPQLGVGLMLDAEWAAGEQAFRELAITTGLQVGTIQRVGFHGPDIDWWQDQSLENENHARLRYQEQQAAGLLELGHSNADGSMSALFKQQLKMEAVEEIGMLTASQGEARAGRLSVVPYMANLAAVLK